VGGVRERAFDQDLEGDLALQARVPGAVNFAHPARPERRKDEVTAYRRAGFEPHGLGWFGAMIQEVISALKPWWACRWLRARNDTGNGDADPWSGARPRDASGACSPSRASLARRSDIE
jgi:hypothetical protein